MEKAGANRVVSIHTAGAIKMANFLIHPNVHEFLEVLTTKGTEIDMAEFRVGRNAPFAGLSLAETDFTSQGIVIVGIRQKDGTLHLPPPSHQKLNPGDDLIAFGKAESLEALTAGAAGDEPAPA